MFRALLRSFSHAIRGLWYCIMNERNIRVHITACAFVYLISPYYGFSRAELTLIAVVVAAVVIAEMVNTAVERTVDMITTEYHPTIKVIKDISAGAVLITAISALVCFGLLFVNENFLVMLRDLNNFPKLAAAAAFIVSAYFFIRGKVNK